jgi:hypothetical protein
MAERRMFAKTIIDSDAFLDMPQSSQLLYFHLSMRGDDEGFINNPKSIMRNVGCKDDDIKLLIAKKFLIPFDSGVVVIKHWRIHNYIQKDRFTPTKYQTEKAMLSLDENKSYTQCIQNVSNMDTQVRLGEVSIGKSNNNTQKSKLFALVDSYSDDETITNLLYDWMDIRKAKRSAQTEKAIKQNLDKLADYAKETLYDIPYHLSAGFIGEKAPDATEPYFGMQCAYLVWYAWNHFGYDLDSDGGRLVTSADLLHSDLLEVVQVYGMEPSTLIPQVSTSMLLEEPLKHLNAPFLLLY